VRPTDVDVFVGPSLSKSRAAAILPANYHSPARRDDLASAAERGAKILVFIDGCFDQDLAVGPAEILHVLRRGIVVYGASSMGALRAVELEDFGMRGVGVVYDWYKTGIVEDEDEVTLVFDPISLSPLSTPLVSIRSIVAEARRRGILTEAHIAHILAVAKGIHYSDRVGARRDSKATSGEHTCNRRIRTVRRQARGRPTRAIAGGGVSK
jgi:hypothetical protein